MGSFNPAHQGHIHISIMAKYRLRLKNIWWFITPQNPFKHAYDLAPIETRLAQAQKITKQYAPFPIEIATPETIFQQQYSFQTLKTLKRAFPHQQFFLLIGSDNLYELPQWHHASQIMKQLPIAIIRRDDYHYPSLLRFRGKLQGLNRYDNSFIVKHRHKLIYLDGKTHPTSSTLIRQSNIL